MWAHEKCLVPGGPSPGTPVVVQVHSGVTCPLKQHLAQQVTLEQRWSVNWTRQRGLSQGYSSEKPHFLGRCVTHTHCFSKTSKDTVACCYETYKIWREGVLRVLHFSGFLVNNQSCWSCSPETPLLQLKLLCQVRKWMKSKSSFVGGTVPPLQHHLTKSLKWFASQLFKTFKYSYISYNYLQFMIKC